MANLYHRIVIVCSICLPAVQPGGAAQSWRTTLDQAEVAANRGEFSQAEKLYLDSLEYAKSEAAPRYWCDRINFEVAHCYLEEGKLDEAEQTFKSFLSRQQTPPAIRLAVLNEFGQLCSQRGRSSEAEKVSIEAVALAKSGGDQEQLNGTQINLAICYMRDKKFDRAYSILHPLLSEEQSGKIMIKPSESHRLHVNMAECFRGQNKYKDAEREARKALSIFERSKLSNSGRYASDLALLAEVIRKQRRSQEAIPLFKRSLVIFKQTGMKPEIIETLGNYARAMRETGKVSQAAEIESQLKRVQSGSEFSGN